jgi:signal transduction histidine kinase
MCNLAEETQREQITCALLRGYGALADTAAAREASAAAELAELQRLRALENRLLCAERTGSAPEGVPVDARVFFVELLTAAGLALAGTGYACALRTVSGARAHAVLVPRALSHAVMNLISNALAHGTGCSVTASLASTRGQIVLQLENSGALDWAAVADGLATPSQGLCAARMVAERHGGRLLLSARDGQSLVTLSLPLAPAQDAPPPKPCADAADLLCDRLSPVHVGLSTLDVCRGALAC